MRERRVAKGEALRKLYVNEALVVLCARHLDCGMLRGEGLHEHLAGNCAAASAARDLRQQLEGALTGAEVGDV